MEDETKIEAAKGENRKFLLWFLLAIFVALLPWFVLAQGAPVKEKFHFDKVMEDQIGYAQAVKVGKTIYISGTVGGGDMATSIRQVYINLEKTLAHYGATFEHVVRENVFTTDIEALTKNAGVRREFYRDDFPAASWIQIERLYDPSFNLEVELTVVLPDKKKNNRK